MSAISVENLSFSYGSNQILNDICIEINCKQIYALLGPSGGGKSTLLKLILGMIKNRNGIIRVMDSNSGMEANCSISFMPQDCALCPQFTVNQTMNYFKNIYSLADHEFRKRYLQLRSLLHLPNGELLVSQLSGGTQRRVSLAIAMINRPTIVILDEPTVGIDPVVRQKIWDFLVDECKRGLTTVIVTHYVEEAASADRVGLMRNGHILAEESPARLMQMFNTNSLEEVFLQLCLIEDQSMKDKGVSFYKNQNSNANLSSSFNPDSYLDNVEDENLFTKLWINSWILLTLIHKNILKFSNMGTSLLIILLPAIQGLIFCVVYSKDLIELKTAVVNEEVDSKYGARLLSSLESFNRHIVQPINYSSLSEAIKAVEDTETIAAIHIPKRFSDAIDNRIIEGFGADNQTVKDSTISVYIDNSIIQYSNGITDSLTQTLLSLLSNIYSENNKHFFGLPIEVEKTENTKDLLTSNYYLPGFYLYYLYISQIVISSLLLTQERQDGLFERSLVAGVSKEVVFISHVITQCLISILQIIGLYLTGFLLFNTINNSSLHLLFAFMFLVQFSAISFGLVISSLVDRDIVCIILVWFIILPQLFCCGLFWPLEGMDKTLKNFFYYVSPLSIPMETMRNLILRGWDLDNHTLRLGFLWSMIPSLLCLTIALMIFKRR